MKRTFVLSVAAALCLTGAAQAQGVSKKYDWDDKSKQSCMEPYAPAVPKPEDTSLKELIEDVKPEIQAFIGESNKYLDCLSVQLADAREARDKEKIKELVKAHNDNVEYQKSVASEFNATLTTLKEEAALALSGSKEGSEGDKKEGAKEGDGKADSAGDEAKSSDADGDTLNDAAKKAEPAETVKDTEKDAAKSEGN